MSLLKKDGVLLVIILVVSFFTWRHIPSLQFIGEGFMYFADWLNGLDKKEGFNLCAKLVFNTLPGLFKDKIGIYMWFQLTIMLLTDLTFYLMVRILTRSSLASFVATLIFSVSYVGKYGMFSVGGYQYFSERAIIVIPLLVSVTLLSLYYMRRRTVYYSASLLCYLGAIYLGYYGTFFLPVMFLYPYVYFLFHHKKLVRDFIKALGESSLFAVGNYLIINSSMYFSDESLVDLIKNLGDYIRVVFQQLVVITLPPRYFYQVIEYFNRITDDSIVREDSIVILGVFVLLWYLGATLVVWRLKPGWKDWVVLAFLSMPLMLMLNAHKNPMEVRVSLETSRYFYYPSIMVSLFWGLFWSAILLRCGFLKVLLTLGFCLLVFSLNYKEIRFALAKEGYLHKANYDTIEKFREWAPELKKEPSVVVTPATLGPYGAHFVYLFYCNPEGTFLNERLVPLDFEKMAKEGTDPESVYYLHYDPEAQVVIDKTEETRIYMKSVQLKNNSRE